MSRYFRRGIVAEFTTPEALVVALERLRDLGYRRLDAFTPFPVKEAERALDLPRSRLPIAIFLFGTAGAVLAYLIMWWCNAYDYPLNVGSFPAHSAPSYIPIVFETTVLFGALAGFFGFFVVARLPRLWDEVFEVEGFERASIDRFFLSIDASDPHFHPRFSRQTLEALGPERVILVGGP